jgi:hypothetical protein
MGKVVWRNFGRDQAFRPKQKRLHGEKDRCAPRKLRHGTITQKDDGGGY